ncbi:hypothetical protein CONLIGDRAFT_685871 [Coniochaeta ligniaria NRRL 30616]|uniref:Uncharacterized protein n=1 Tax=Coniochaeta ligniaria NRRL 30616 TaxID=1408157 RepID=A0A1J7I9X3_9PEZI|nr:hypothetical protein CONLIGDRAFT_685871 [Coniochaeta ligniaria NRRL 30616]
MYLRPRRHRPPLSQRARRQFHQPGEPENQYASQDPPRKPTKIVNQPSEQPGSPPSRSSQPDSQKNRILTSPSPEELAVNLSTIRYLEECVPSLRLKMDPLMKMMRNLTAQNGHCAAQIVAKTRRHAASHLAIHHIHHLHGTLQPMKRLFRGDWASPASPRLRDDLPHTIPHAKLTRPRVGRKATSPTPGSGDPEAMATKSPFLTQQPQAAQSARRPRRRRRLERGQEWPSHQGIPENVQARYSSFPGIDFSPTANLQANMNIAQLLDLIPHRSCRPRAAVGVCRAPPEFRKIVLL